MIYSLPNGVEFELTIDIINDWGSGFVTKVSIKNISSVPLENWDLTLDLAAGLTAQNSNQMTFSQTGTEVTFAPNKPWLSVVSPNETASFTFRSDGDIGDPLTDILPLTMTADGTTSPLDDSGTGTGEITEELIVKDTWGSGGWLQAIITNGTGENVTDWLLPIDLPAGLTFQSSGAVNFITDGNGDTFLEAKKPQFEDIPSGDTIAVGFNVQGDPALISQIVLGDLVGATPPAAVNDSATPYTYDTATGVLTIDQADVLANDSSSDGSPINLVDATTVAGGGTTAFFGSSIEYTVNPVETGRIVIGYEIEDGAGLTDTAQIFVDLPVAPTLTVSDVVVNEADGTATFDVTLTGPLALLDTVEVDFATRDREALAGLDYTAVSGTLQFTDANRVQQVVVPLLDDSVEELTETFDLLLSNAIGARIEGRAGEATILDDAGDTGPLGDTTAGLDIQVSLAGEFVVGHTFLLEVTNTSGATFTQAPIVTVGVQDGMKLQTQTGDYSPLSGSSVAQDGFSAVVASHDDRYFTMALNPTFPDGTWDDGDTATFELFFRGSHFFEPLADRIEISPVNLEAETPERPFVPLDLTFKGFNTTFFNRSDVTPEDVEASFDEQQALGANSIAIVTTHFMDDKDSTEVRANDFTMTDADLIDAIQTAKDDGLSVLLKPHIDLDSGQFRGRLLNTAGPAKIEEFFGRDSYDPMTPPTYAAGSYGELIMRYASIAEAEGVDVMLVGTELVDLAKNRANLPYWEQLIEDVRSVYTGDLSYATIVGEELFVRFWEELDYISLDIYPPLTDTSAPSVGELIDGWTELPTTERGLEAYFNQPITDLIAGMSEQYGLKVLITETGFRSVDGIAARPFDFDLQGFADLQEQVDAYESFFVAAEETMGEYLEGVFLWEYPNQPAAPDGTVKQAFGYTPQNKPVFDLIDDFFDLA